MLGSYTSSAMREGRQADIFRAGVAWRQAGRQSLVEAAVASAKGVGIVAWGAITTPYRLITQSIPNFGRAVSERMQGKDRTWDVLFTGTMLEADIAGTYAIAKPTGIVDRVNASVERSVAGGLSIETPNGVATQRLSFAALRLKSQVAAGRPLFRGGALGRSAAAEAQYWASESTLSPGYTRRYGVASFSRPEFVIEGRLREGAAFVTRTAPAVGRNPGGALEIVTEPNAVRLDAFYMTDP